eukprot:TRINITY_DN43173_c0_g1_i1.p1 TRINITY_DN43173_c0_g1~~TRINITY_DN43173_c0_g1_i1.p1  ORF type:complete len:533 (+),score=109.11 TRINITY_DN43173_c0_g1_i1:64-1599(+)
MATITATILTTASRTRSPPYPPLGPAPSRQVSPMRLATKPALRSSPPMAPALGCRVDAACPSLRAANETEVLDLALQVLAEGTEVQRQCAECIQAEATVEAAERLKARLSALTVAVASALHTPGASQFATVPRDESAKDGGGAAFDASVASDAVAIAAEVDDGLVGKRRSEEQPLAPTSSHVSSLSPILQCSASSCFSPRCGDDGAGPEAGSGWSSWRREAIGPPASTSISALSSLPTASGAAASLGATPERAKIALASDTGTASGVTQQDRRLPPRNSPSLAGEGTPWAAVSTCGATSPGSASSVAAKVAVTAAAAVAAHRACAAEAQLLRHLCSASPPAKAFGFASIAAEAEVALASAASFARADAAAAVAAAGIGAAADVAAGIGRGFVRRNDENAGDGSLNLDARKCEAKMPASAMDAASELRAASARSGGVAGSSAKWRKVEATRQLPEFVGGRLARVAAADGMRPSSRRRSIRATACVRSKIRNGSTTLRVPDLPASWEFDSSTR